MADDHRINEFAQLMENVADPSRTGYWERTGLLRLSDEFLNATQEMMQAMQGIGDLKHACATVALIALIISEKGSEVRPLRGPNITESRGEGPG